MREVSRTGLLFLLLPLLLVSLTGCRTAAPAPSASGPGKMVLTQQQRVGLCTHRDREGADAFTGFLDVASPFALIPGLNQHFVPQGLARSEETGYLYVSGYFPDWRDNPFSRRGNPSAIGVLDPQGQLVAEYALYLENGSPLEGHVGGVAVCGGMLFLSAPSSGARDFLAAIPLSTLTLEGHQDVTVKNLFPVPVEPAFLSSQGDTLWLGNFYREGFSPYGPPPELGITEVPGSGEAMAGYLLEYHLPEGDVKGLVPEAGQPFALPDRAFLLPQKIQGMALGGDGTIFLSQSHGRQNLSALLGYHPSRAQGVTLSLAGTGLEAGVLEDSCETFRLTALPMAEGITTSPDGRGLLVLFESGAAHYDGGGGQAPGIFRTDNIWALSLPEEDREPAFGP